MIQHPKKKVGRREKRVYQEVGGRGEQQTQIGNQTGVKHTQRGGQGRRFGVEISNGVLQVANQETHPQLIRKNSSKTLGKEVSMIQTSNPMIVEEPTQKGDYQLKKFGVFCYQKNIMRYVYQLQKRDSQMEDFLEIQMEITPKMRETLINWMNYTNMLLDLSIDTFFKAVGIVDRVLSKKVINRKQFQLLGIASLFVASKYQEIKCHPIGKFINSCSVVCTAMDVLQMESEILITLSFNLNIVSPLYVVDYKSQKNNLKQSTNTFTKYILELALTEYCMVKYNSNMLGLAALYFAGIIKSDQSKDLEILFDDCMFEKGLWDKCCEDLLQIYDNRMSEANEVVNTKYGLIPLQ